MWKPREMWRKQLDEGLKSTAPHETPDGKDSWIYYAGEEPYFDTANDDVSFEGLSSPEILKERVSARHAQNEKVMFLDVFGQGMYGFTPAQEPGEDLNIAATYLDPKDTFQGKKKGERHFAQRKVERVSGDMFDPLHWKKVLQRIDEKRQEGYVLDTAFVRPVGGLDAYADKPAAWRYLFNTMLRDVYERLPEKGQILVELSSFPEAHHEDVIDFFRRLFIVEENGSVRQRIQGIRCTQKKHAGYDRPVFKLEKMEGAPAKLPTLQAFRNIYGVAF